MGAESEGVAEASSGFTAAWSSSEESVSSFSSCRACLRVRPDGDISCWGGGNGSTAAVLVAAAAAAAAAMRCCRSTSPSEDDMTLRPMAIRGTERKQPTHRIRRKEQTKRRVRSRSERRRRGRRRATASARIPPHAQRSHGSLVGLSLMVDRSAEIMHPPCGRGAVLRPPSVCARSQRRSAAAVAFVPSGSTIGNEDGAVMVRGGRKVE